MIRVIAVTSLQIGENLPVILVQPPLPVPQTLCQRFLPARLRPSLCRDKANKILDTAKKVLQNLNDAEQAQDRAKQAIEKARDNIEAAEKDLDQVIQQRAEMHAL